MDQLRRAFLKNAGIAGAVMVAIGTGLLRSGEVLAANMEQARIHLDKYSRRHEECQLRRSAESKDIQLKLPDIAENGASVPIEVTSHIPGTTSIAIFVEKNQNPLVADFELSNGAEPYINTFIKMSQTSQVRVAVKAGGKAYTQGKEVKVTIGGCGG